jgi:3-oxoacyl-[acyl-carrier protein] reductase
MGKLDGKVALVTGSGRNIGRATVLRLAGEGAHVVVNARANQQEAEAVAREARDLRVKAVPILADVGKKAEVEALAAKALSEFGRVDILINNAAMRPHKPFTETTDADWELVRGVVLDGALYLTRALIEPMVENRCGRILFFVGDGAISARGSGRTHLSAAKMGLIGMARGLASEFAQYNIRVNVVSPGSIDTRRDDPESAAKRRRRPARPARHRRRDRCDLPISSQRGWRLHHRPDDPRQWQRALLLICSWQRRGCSSRPCRVWVSGTTALQRLVECPHVGCPAE